MIGVEVEGVVDELLATLLASGVEVSFALSVAPVVGVAPALDDAVAVLGEVEAKLGSRFGSTGGREGCERIIASSLA